MGDLIDLTFEHLQEHGFPGNGCYIPSAKSAWRYHLHYHGLGPDPWHAKTVWDPQPAAEPPSTLELT